MPKLAGTVVSSGGPGCRRDCADVVAGFPSLVKALGVVAGQCSRKGRNTVSSSGTLGFTQKGFRQAEITRAVPSLQVDSIDEFWSHSWRGVVLYKARAAKYAVLGQQ